MPERTATIASAVGLHARPAGVFTQRVKASGLAVKIAKEGGQFVNAASPLSIMTLGAQHGDQVLLSAEGDNADAVLDSLVALLESDLD